MPQIRLIIGGRPYEISCNDGDEAHIRSLAITLDKRVQVVSASLGQASDSMVLAVTALTMEDTIRSLENNVPNISENIPAMPAQNDNAITDQINRAVTEALLPLTEKLEELANSLELK